MRNKLGLWLSRLTEILLARMSPATYEGVILRSLQARNANLPPDEALKLFLRLDNDLYKLSGTASIRYGDGQHSKQRHIRYADFFLAHLAPNQRILDIGCGTGFVAGTIAQAMPTEIVGIDLNAASIGTAQARYAHPNVRYIVGDVLSDLETLLDDPRFDAVILSNVLEHLPDRANFLRRVRAVTGAKRFLIRVPTFERDWRVPLKQELGLEWRLDPTHETEYTLESFAAEMRESGLTVIHQEGRWGEIWAVLEVNP